MSDIVKVMALGGLDESGNDCYVIDINNDIFVIDAGSRIPDKSIPGVDFLLPNLDYVIEHKDRVKAYIMTHGHDENMGALQYFYNSAPAPVYCTKATMMIMDAEAKRFNLKPNFMYKIVKPSDVLNIAGHEVRLFQTMHNSSYSFGVAINTDKGYVVYTGDYIIEFNSQEDGYYFDLAAVEEIAKKPTLILLSESKSAHKDGYCAPNHSVCNNISKHFKDNDKRIFITCFWQNSYRINEICKLVREYHKKIYFYNDYTANVMEILMNSDQTLCLRREDILSKEDLLRTKDEDIVILLLGRGEKLYLELQKLVYKTNEDKRIVLKPEDCFINVALPTPTLETLATKSMDALYRVGCEVVWVKSKKLSSMHAHQSDLRFFLTILKPKYYFPVRGSFVDLMANAKLALSTNSGYNHTNIFILDNGMQIVFDEAPRPHILPPEANNINTSKVLVDGMGISRIANQVIEDRRKLGVDGVVIIAATVSKTEKKIISGPDCQMRGFVFVKEAEPLLKSISQIFVEEVTIALAKDSLNFEEAINNIKERSRRFIRRENGREPMIIPMIIAH